jgi:uncharacterized RDD family membrane protein YckC
MHSIPSFLRCMASFVYESILLFAILFVAGIFYRAVFGDPHTDWQQHFFFLYSWFLVGVYFVYCWVKSGQTLAMKTWRIQLLRRTGSAMDWATAIKRYILASFSLMFFGLGFIWRFFDREGLFLHDRLTGCQLILTPKD